MGLGHGTNNHAELISLRHLIYFSILHHCRKIQIFGDSKIVIDWFNNTVSCNAYTLRSIMDEVVFSKHILIRVVALTSTGSETRFPISYLMRSWSSLGVYGWSRSRGKWTTISTTIVHRILGHDRAWFHDFLSYCRYFFHKIVLCIYLFLTCLCTYY